MVAHILSSSKRENIPFIQLLSPLYFLSSIFGELPCKYNKTTGKFAVHKGWRIYGLCTVSFCVAIEVTKTAERITSAVNKAASGELLLKIAIHLVLVAFNLLSLFYVGSCNKRLSGIFNAMKRLQTELKGLKQSAVVWQIKTIVIGGQLASNALYFGSIFYNFQYHESFFMNAYTIMTIIGRACSGSLVNCIGAHFVTICLILGSYLRGVADELESLNNEYSTEQLAQLKRLSSKIFELANEVNEIYGLLLLLILTYHNCYLQIDAFKAAVVLYNISSGRAIWSIQDCSSFLWACVDCAKAMVYISAANKMEYEFRYLKKALAKQICRLTSGSSLKKELRAFCGVVATYSLSFTACGFFYIDWQLVSASSSAGLINVILLLQSYITATNQTN